MSILSFELSLLELASGARESRVWTTFGPGSRVGCAAQFIVMLF